MPDESTQNACVKVDESLICCSWYVVRPKKAPDEGATGGEENPSASQKDGE